ncbi:ABC transporter permease [Pedobacter chitinilyticus]|uniref:ABC transporter permease n=1 Tax=Pedobacter chitinilyticus TaxID=2233776 RepID=A0A443Z0I3_9SPHI|nr:ABC transporter permease [Pedobacter chitinilyticus]RWU10004.1 ABC transporter permease [Pedobacter chitinilyticus]
MNKILLIIQREYFSRVKKKSFIVMTFLTPLLIAGVYALIGFFAYKGIKDTHDKVAVVSTNKTLTEKLSANQNVAYVYIDKSLEQAKKDLSKANYDYILYLPEFSLAAPKGVELFGAKQPGMSLNRRISGDIEELIKTQKLKESGISQTDLDKLKTSVDISTKKIAETGKEEESSAGASTFIAFTAGVLMFMFIMMYGIQVMRGVIEEKTNRIIEVIVSSVKPFQLMMGKIVGIALVGLTQFMLWIVLTLAISTAAVSLFTNKEDIKEITASTQAQTQISGAEQVTSAAPQGPVADIQKSLAGLDVGKIIVVFLFFFLGGYLFYSALYAAIGSAVDSETETQQFMLPVMLPLLLGYALSLSVVTNDPYGSTAFWLSMIPFTSPIAMVVRIPYGVPGWELALSMAILAVGFVVTVWIAGRIYRVGILMYGKKTTFKEMFKWFTYKN